jgi:prevent-host-death family protein
MVVRMLLSQARHDFAATVNRVAHKDDRVILQRNGKDFVAVVPIEDLELLERLEDQADIAAARKARKEAGIPWEQAKKRLALTDRPPARPAKPRRKATRP